MRLRIRRRHDYSWPVGWLALALEVAAVPAAVVTSNCNDTCVSDYFLGTFWLGASLPFSLLSCSPSSPRHREKDGLRRCAGSSCS
jgi:hypothetical protein